MTDPIQPSNPGGTGSTGNAQTIPQNSTPQTPVKPANTSDSSNLASIAVPLPKLVGASPIKSQHRDSRGQPEFNPARIVFLTGPLKGKQLDLGLNLNESENGQEGKWTETNSKIIRPGIIFTGISGRDFNITLTYYDLNHDISHLVENLFKLLEIDTTTRSAPLFSYTQGDLIAAPCVCKSIRPKYSEPLSGSRGFHKCEVAIAFTLGGGKGSPHAFGPPLTSTPLGDIEATTLKFVQQKKGVEQVVGQTLAPCVGQEGSQQIQDIIDSDRVNDAYAWNSLDANTFVQAAIAGLIPTDLLSSPPLSDKLANDLADIMAQTAPGVKGTPYVDAVAEAIKTGAPSAIAALPQSVQPTASSLASDYRILLPAIKSGGVSSLQDDAAGLSAFKTLSTFGSCGLSLNQTIKGVPVGTSNPQQTLDWINTYFKKKPDLSEVKIAFGVNDDVAKRLADKSSFSDKSEFVKYATPAGGDAIAGYSAWDTFAKWYPAHDGSGGSSGGG